MSFSPAPKIPGSFPRSATPSPQKQPAPIPIDDDMPPVPVLPIPGAFHVDQQHMPIPATTHVEPQKTAVPAYGHTDRTSTGFDQSHMAIPAGGHMNQHSVALPAEKQSDHCTAVIPALQHMDQESSSGCGSGNNAVERVDSPFEQPQTSPHEAADASDKDPVEYDYFDSPDQTLTALPSMDESPDRLRASQDSGVPINLNKTLPATPQSKRLFSFRSSKEKLASKEQSSRQSIDTATSEESTSGISRSRRVVTSVGGGLRSLKLLNRSHRVMPAERSLRSSSSSNMLGSKFSLQSFNPFKDKPATFKESSDASAGGLGEFEKPGWLEFPLPPGQQAVDPQQMRIRAALLEQEEEEASIRVALEETVPPDVEPVDWSGPGMRRARRRSQKAVDKGKSSGASSPDSITTVLRHRRRRPFKQPVDRSSSTDTVIRRPVTTTSAADDKNGSPEETMGDLFTPVLKDLDKDEGSHSAGRRSVSTQTPAKYSLFPSEKDPRELPPPVRHSSARRESIPARLPLSPALLGQPVHATGPSARSSPATSSPAVALYTARRTSTNADNRAARRQSRNFSRPFAIAGHEAANECGGNQRSITEGGSVGLALSKGESPVKPQRLTPPLDNAPDDWPLDSVPVDNSS